MKNLCDTCTKQKHCSFYFKIHKKQIPLHTMCYGYSEITFLTKLLSHVALAFASVNLGIFLFVLLSVSCLVVGIRNINGISAISFLLAISASIRLQMWAFDKYERFLI